MDKGTCSDGREQKMKKQKRTREEDIMKELGGNRIEQKKVKHDKIGYERLEYKDQKIN